MIKNQIICAAIKFGDGTIIRGHRHDGCFLYAMNIPHIKKLWETDKTNEQGFMDSRNKFVSRKTAMRIQIKAGIKSFMGTPMKAGKILFSEDLY